MKKNKEGMNRHSVTAFSVTLSVLFVFLAVHISSGGGQFLTRLSEFTVKLYDAIDGLDTSVNYTDYVDNATYLSDAEFDAGGMSALYRMTNSFVNDIGPEDVFMRKMFTITSDNDLEINLADSSSIASYYASLVAALIFLVVCAILFLLGGLCFCCCRCCGNCGAKPKASNQNESIKNIVLSTLLVLCIGGLLFTLICAFGSNQQMQDGLEEFPTNLNNAIVDTSTYMNSTNKAIYHLLYTNYQEFSNVSTNLMDNGGVIAMGIFKNYTNLTAVSTVYDFIDSLESINETLTSINDGLFELKVYASQLNDALRQVSTDLSATLSDPVCIAITQCNSMNSKIEVLQTSIDFSKIPDITDTIDSFKALDGISDKIREGQEQLNLIETQINDSLNNGIEQAKQKLEEAGTLIQNNLNSVTETVNDVRDQIESSAEPAVKNTQQYIDDYGHYRNTVAIVISVVLLVVTICLLLGLTFGVFGKRPTGNSSGCFDKSMGSHFLISAVILIFLVGFLISLLTFFTLFSGVVLQKAICDPFRDPDPDKYTLIYLLDQYDLMLDVNITPSTLLTKCHQNLSIYKTFNLDSKFNLTEITNQINISDSLNAYLNFSDLNIDTDFNFADTIDFDALRSINPNISVDDYLDDLSQSLTNYNFDELTSDLEAVILIVGDGNEVSTQLNLCLYQLNIYKEKLVVPMTNLLENLENNVTDLNEQLKMGHANYSDAIDNLQTEINEAQSSLSTGATEALNQTASAFINITEEVVIGFIDRVTLHLEDKIGQCGPLSLVINGTLTSTCDKVLLPWNGFWFSLFWTIVFYLITIVVAVMLGSLYKKPASFRQYSENRNDHRGRKKGNKSGWYDDRPYPEMARNYPPGPRPASRYEDMAPKYGYQNPSGRYDPNDNYLRSTRF